MRDFKFRIWVDNKMIGPFSLQAISSLAAAHMAHDPNIVIEQFTGLNDKNGNEIYEGDVYKPHHSKSHYQVMFINGCFVGGKSEDSCMPLSWDVNSEGGEIVESNSNWLEVVGNIHDNPELLNPARGNGPLHMKDPNVKEPAAAGEPANSEAAQESAAQDQATGASEEVIEG